VLAEEGGKSRSHPSWLPEVHVGVQAETKQVKFEVRTGQDTRAFCVGSRAPVDSQALG